MKLMDVLDIYRKEKYSVYKPIYMFTPGPRLPLCKQRRPRAKHHGSYLCTSSASTIFFTPLTLGSSFIEGITGQDMIDTLTSLNSV